MVAFYLYLKLSKKSVFCFDSSAAKNAEAIDLLSSAASLQKTSLPKLFMKKVLYIHIHVHTYIYMFEIMSVIFFNLIVITSSTID